MSEIVLFNPEQSPMVYDAQGRSVGGAERVTVTELDEVGQRAVDAGLLVREESQREEPKEDAKKDSKATASKSEPETKNEDAPPLPQNGEESDKDSGASRRGKQR